jgi:hypothetical protein
MHVGNVHAGLDGPYNRNNVWNELMLETRGGGSVTKLPMQSGGTLRQQQLQQQQQCEWQ